MHLFCPACGRLTRYNDDMMGITPKLCPACVFHIQKALAPSQDIQRPRRAEARLRLYGCTLVQN